MSPIAADNFFLKFIDGGVHSNSPNFRLASWPPRPDTAVTLDSDGNVLSRYSDPCWDISHHCQRTYRLYFRDGRDQLKRIISPENGELFRQCLAWWWWGPQAVSRAKELDARFFSLRQIFALCTKQGISADRLHRHPKVVAMFRHELKPSRAALAIRLLHDIYEARGHLGFFLLTREQIATLANEIPAHTRIQTPYIPPRIWQLLARRTTEVIDSFRASQSQFEQLFRANVDYATTGSSSDSINIQDYPLVVADLRRWLKSTGRQQHALQSLSGYATLVSVCCLAQIVFYSLMRAGEAWCLPLDCFQEEKDSLGELIYSVRGNSTKTVQDPDARWIVCRSTSYAVATAAAVAKLRLSAGQMMGVLGSEAELGTAPLFPRSYEPWTKGSSSQLARFLHVRPAFQELNRELRRFNLLSDDELRINEEDMATCRLLNPMADPEVYSVGKLWPLAWHQLRRTGAVNMHASGLVSDASIQYELKHAKVAMSRYYGRGHHLLSSGLSEDAKREFVRSMYDVLALEFSKLRESTYVSPYGDAHKMRILSPTSELDHKRLLKEAKKGTIAYREHLLGGCANPSPCDKGGFESVAACGGNGKPCEWLLYDKNKLPKYRTLLVDIDTRLSRATPAEPLAEALHGQADAVRAAIRSCEEHHAA